MPKTKCKRPKQYSKKYFKKPFPPNHNPLIGTLHKDTLINVRDTLYAIQELTDHPDGLMLTDKSTVGLHFLSTCIINALHFEIEHRK